ncbi:MAG: AcrB/AcrD/AcrF family protein [Alphaproteobacteria bacterium]|nr:AcrB/AcrD/AcrF family protein [Alphaproteobacteria bacterium]
MIGVLFNRRLLILVIAFLLAIGVGALLTLPRAEDPTIKARSASITTLYSGAGAERVEALVTQPIEEEIRTLSEVDEVSSVSRAGVSIVTVTLRDEISSVEPVWSRVRDKLSDLEASLPSDAGTPNLNDEGGYAYTVGVAITWQSASPPDRLILQRYAKALSERLRSVPGTDHVEVHGDVPERVDVTINEDAVRAAGLDVADIARTLATADARGSAGQIVGPGNTLTVELTGSFDSLTRLREVPVISASGQTLRLGDIATFSRALQDPPGEIGFHNGDPAVFVGARMQTGQRVDLWVSSALEAVEEFRSRDVSGIDIDVVFEQASYTQDRLSSVFISLLQGLIIVVGVLIFTMGIRSAIAVGVTIPLVALTTIGLFPIVGIELHQMSIVGIIVALGLMVDNAIIMTNDIRDDLAKGDTFAGAVRHAISKLFWPLLASTVTTMLAFMPIVLLPGAAGEFVGPMAIAVLCALASSFLISMFALPAFAPLIFKERAAEPGARLSWLSTGISLPMLAGPFRSVIGFFIRRPLLGVITSLAIPIIGIGALPTVPTVFFPPADRDQFRIEVKLPQTSSIEATTRELETIDAFIRAEEGVHGTLVIVGAAAPQLYYNVISSESANPAFADIIVNTETPATTARLIPVLQQRLPEEFPNASIAVLRYDFGPPVAKPIEMRIIGPDLETLAVLGQEAAGILANVPGAVRAGPAMHRDALKFAVDVDEDAAKRVGLGLGDISAQLNAALTGSVGGFVLEDTEQLPVTVRYANEARSGAAELSAVSLTPPIGGAATGVPLTAIAEIGVAPAWVDLQRKDGERLQTISSYVAYGELPSEVLARFQAALDEAAFKVPPGYRIEFGGEAEARGDAVGTLLSQVSILLVLAVTTLLLVLNSFRRMLIVFVAGAMALGFGFLVLKLTGNNFGFLIVVGVMGLIGVGLNDTIVIVSAFDENEDARGGNPDALLDIVSGSVARHVWSTTITTAGGFVPLMLTGGEFWPPFAQVFAGGLLLLTIAAFIFAPSAYRLAVRMRQGRTNPASAALRPILGD